ncbi:MAG: four helix bundle protein [Planctomycetes bacterium]|nr:four helix bundle protein [Planctomycetota bacterium]
MTCLANLAVYHLARSACADAYRLASTITGNYDLRDQARRAAASIVLNIAEGRGRSTDADFARFLVIARGSANELAAQLAFAADLQLIERDGLAEVLERLDHVGRMLSALIKRLGSS